MSKRTRKLWFAVPVALIVVSAATVWLREDDSNSPFRSFKTIVRAPGARTLTAAEVQSAQKLVAEERARLLAVRTVQAHFQTSILILNPDGTPLPQDPEMQQAGSVALEFTPTGLRYRMSGETCPLNVVYREAQGEGCSTRVWQEGLAAAPELTHMTGRHLIAMYGFAGMSFGRIMLMPIRLVKMKPDLGGPLRWSTPTETREEFGGQEQCVFGLEGRRESFLCWLSRDGGEYRREEWTLKTDGKFGHNSCTYTDYVSSADGSAHFPGRTVYVEHSGPGPEPNQQMTIVLSDMQVNRPVSPELFATPPYAVPYGQ